MNWKSIAKWSLLIFLTAQVVGTATHAIAMAMAHDKETSQASVTAMIFVGSSLLYCLFLRANRRFLLRHAIAAFLVVEALDWSIALFLGASFTQMLVDWAPSARHLASVFVGLAIAALTVRHQIPQES